MFKRLGVFMLFAGLLVASAAHATTYRCLVNGSVYISDKPCPTPTPPPSPTFGYYGPARTSTIPTTAYVPPTGKQQAYVAYLSAECTSLNDALRTAPVRGVSGSALRDLQQEYGRKCLIEDLAARSQDLGKVLTEQVQRYQSQVAARDETQRHAAQCTGMLDVLRTKRSRVAGMDDDEKAALRALDASYNERCLSH